MYIKFLRAKLMGWKFEIDLHYITFIFIYNPLIWVFSITSENIFIECIQF